MKSIHYKDVNCLWLYFTIGMRIPVSPMIRKRKACIPAFFERKAGDGQTVPDDSQPQFPFCG